MKPEWIWYKDFFVYICAAPFLSAFICAGLGRKVWERTRYLQYAFFSGVLIGFWVLLFKERGIRGSNYDADSLRIFHFTSWCYAGLAFTAVNFMWFLLWYWPLDTDNNPQYPGTENMKPSND